MEDVTSTHSQNSPPNSRGYFTMELEAHLTHVRGTLLVHKRINLIQSLYGWIKTDSIFEFSMLPRPLFIWKCLVDSND